MGTFAWVTQERIALQMGYKQEEAFPKSKELLKLAEFMVHFDCSKEFLLACDTSSDGMGAVLSYKLEDESERPIAYASRAPTTLERKYSQLDKEGLERLFVVKKFHKTIYHIQISQNFKWFIL